LKETQSRVEREQKAGGSALADSLKICGVEVKPGTRMTIDLPIARLYTHTEMTIPVHVIRGKRDGPRLFISAALHGDEVNGVEIVRRLLGRKLINRVHGTLITIPVVNVYGFLNLSRYSPDRRDLNRFFPGREAGSLTSRLAYLFMEEIVQLCTHGIDLHTGSNHRSNLPQIRAYLDNRETKRLAAAFGAPVILSAGLLEGSLRQAAKDRNIQILLYEAGEALRFDEVAIRAGLNGIISVMRAIDMLPRSRAQQKFQPLVAHSSYWVRAPISGILRSDVSLGDKVTRNAKIGEISDPFGEEKTDVIATTRGIVIGKQNLPLVHKGDALFHIACPKKMAEAASIIEVFEEEFDPEALK
jgi:predicted deacylase